MGHLRGSGRPARGVAYVCTHTIAATNGGPNAGAHDRGTFWGADNGPHNGQSIIHGARGSKWMNGGGKGEHRRQAAA